MNSKMAGATEAILYHCRAPWPGADLSEERAWGVERRAGEVSNVPTVAPLVPSARQGPWSQSSSKARSS